MEVKEEQPTQRLNVEEMLPVVGEFGRYQKLLCLILSVTLFPVSIQPVFGYFATLTPTWKCSGKSLECTFDRIFPGTNTSRCNMSRNAWDYTKGASYSMVTQYELHCEKKYVLTLIISIFFAGWGIGAIVIGWIADEYGRKKVIMPCVAVSYILGFMSPFIPSVYVVILLRFVIGFVFPGVLVQVLILITEYVGNDSRPVAKTFPGAAGFLAWIVAAMKMYYLQNWKSLSIACNAPYVFVLLFHFCIPESARWLHLNNRSNEAMKILQKVSKKNNKKIPSYITLSSASNITIQKPKTSAIALFKTRSLRIKSLVNMYLWLNISLLGYGLLFAAGNLGGSLYVNFIVMASTGFPAMFIGAFVNRKFGRKPSTVGFLLVGALMCLSIAVVPKNRNFHVLRVVLGVVGKLCDSATFYSLYVWVQEIYPTSVRSIGVGVMQASARVGAAAAPLVVMLGSFGEWIPFVLIGVMTLVGGGIAFLLPETKGAVLEDSVTVEAGIGKNEMQAIRSSTDNGCASDVYKV